MSEDNTVASDSTEATKRIIVDQDKPLNIRVCEDLSYSYDVERETERRFLECKQRSFVARFRGLEKDTPCSRRLSDVLLGFMYGFVGTSIVGIIAAIILRIIKIKAGL